MKVAILCVMFCFYTRTSGFFGGGGWPTAAKKPRDCRWQDWGNWEHCTADYTGSPTSSSKRKRVQIPAQHGGKPCTDTRSEETKSCTPIAYVASNLYSTIFSNPNGGRGGGGSKTARRTINVNSAAKTPVTAKTCTPVEDIKDENGYIIMSGRTCPSTRKKRALSFSHAATRKRSRRQVLSTKNRDVLFLIDESGSVGVNNYKKILRMVRALSNSFCGAISIGKDLTRIGLMSFNRAQFPQMDFDQYFAKATLLSKLTSPNIKYHGYPSAGATCLVDALKFTRSKMLTPARGARIGVSGTERLVVLMTDGCANCVYPDTKLNNTLKAISKQFSKQGIPIITFLITQATTKCYDIMRGLSDGSHCYQQYWAPSWAKLDEMSANIEGYPCMDAWMIGPSC